MANQIKELDVVALLRPFADVGLQTGQVGTVVESLGEGAFEVEFSDDEGRVYAMLAVSRDDLMVLHYGRDQAA
ncbi:MAG: DUF4926 domain-containing protein [Zoogloeaceae bacterium]|nr:DUF4926 domain-containing protein [Zoogloeaceae bacterium]